MVKFETIYRGHAVNARKALIALNLVTKEELAYMSDFDVEQRINDSNYLVLQSGDDFVLIPYEYEDKLIWIKRDF